MEFMQNLHVSKWLTDLLNAYQLSWQELLNLGETKLRITTRYRFSERINDK